MKKLIVKFACLYLLLFAYTGPAQAENNNAQLTLSPASLSSGANATLSFDLTNSVSVTALQFDFMLPDGLSVNTMTNEDGDEVPAITLTERKKSSHSLSCNKLANGKYAVAILSMKNQAFNEESGALVNISVAVSSMLPTGSYDISVSRVVICPLADGKPGETIMQPDFTSRVSVTNASGETGSAQLSLVTGRLKAGTEQTVSLDMTNGIEVTAMQFNVTLPEGVTLCTMKNEDNETVPAIMLTDRKKSSHSLSSNRQENGSYTVVILSMKNQAFSGINGALVDMKLSVATTVSTGSYDVAIRDIVIVPLLNGRPGIAIKQPDFTTQVYVENTGGGGPVTGPVGLSIPETILAPGSEGTCNINMVNDRNICAFQFRIKLPEGISIVEEYEGDEWGPSILLTDRKKSTHRLSYALKEDGSYRVVVFSLQNATFKDNSGAVVAIKVKVDPDMKEGNYGVILSEAMVVTPSEEKITQEDASYTIHVMQDVGIENENANGISCICQEGVCLVRGTSAGDLVEAFHVEGRNIYSESSTGEQLVIPGAEFPSVLIVRVSRDGKLIYVRKLVSK